MNRRTDIAISALTAEDCTQVALNMRARDRAEIFTLKYSDSTIKLVEDCMDDEPFAWSVTKEGVPVAAFGAGEVSPTVWQVWLFATDDFPKVARPASRFIRNVMIPALVRRGARRAQCYSIDYHTDAHTWLTRSLGATLEAVMPEFGSLGETFHCYRWLARDVRT